jgi:DNA-binding winged helix-turn-helix (wHTH) protein
MSRPSQHVEKDPHPRYRVDDLEVDTGRAVVTRNGVELPLPKLSFDLLRALIEIAPAVAITDALLDRVWPGLVVNPETVAARVKLLRDAIGDDPKQPRYILAVRARGYRLIPPVERLPDFQPEAKSLPSSPDPAQPSLTGGTERDSADTRSHRTRNYLIAGIATLAILAALVLGTVIRQHALPLQRPAETSHVTS